MLRRKKQIQRDDERESERAKLRDWVRTQSILYLSRAWFFRWVCANSRIPIIANINMMRATTSPYPLESCATMQKSLVFKRLSETFFLSLATFFFRFFACYWVLRISIRQNEQKPRNVWDAIKLKYNTCHRRVKRKIGRIERKLQTKGTNVRCIELYEVYWILL